MRIRDKLSIVFGIVFLSLLLVITASAFAMSELLRYQTTAEKGTELISRSRAVFSLMKDLSVTAFAPELYSRMKDVFYYEKFDVTLRTWTDAVADFRTTFRTFLDDSAVRQMARTDSLVGDEYSTALTMSGKAFGRLDTVMDGFRKLGATGLLNQPDSYQRIVSSPDQQISGLFSEVRVTSYYLRNNFESFMNYFVTAMTARVESTRQALTLSAFALALVTAAFSMSFSLLIGNRIVRSVQSLQHGMTGLSKGDFTTHLRVTSRDELGDLARTINTLVDDLRNNIDRLLVVTRDIGAVVDAQTDLDTIRRTIVETAVRDLKPAGLALLPRAGGVGGLRPPVAAGLLADPPGLDSLQQALGPLGTSARFLPSALGPGSSVILCPLPEGTADHGHLAAVTAPGEEPFTDLDFIILQSLADFASLSLDNYLRYRELVELREAEYQSLQARIQPHFLYNVLNGLVGLNRMGDRPGLEAAVLDLKDLLRYTLDRDRTVTLDEELAFVKRYLDLQKLRFGERFDYRLDCHPECRTLRLPKLLLQPLAENALIHGLETLARPGRLDITAEPSAEGVTIVVADTGAGFDPATVGLDRRIGLSNVLKRLELAYPGSGFTVDSAPDAGCRITLALRTAEARL